MIILFVSVILFLMCMCCFVVVVKEIKKWLVNSVHMNMKLIKWQKEQHIIFVYENINLSKRQAQWGETLPRGANHVRVICHFASTTSN